jgi:hypothetical protein
MNELDDGSYEGISVDHAPPANGSPDRVTGSHAGEEPGELLTRDEYAAHTEHDTAVGDAPQYIEEADLASIDAYDQDDGATDKALTRDEYAELADQGISADDGVPEHIEEADLAAIDAYDTAHDQAASRAQNEDPSEAPGGTLTEHAGHDADPPETEDARDPDAGHAETRESDTERISALEAENAGAQQRIADLEARNDEQAAHLERIEQLLAAADRQPVTDGIQGEEGHRDVPATRQDLESPGIAAREDVRSGADTRDDKPARWRRIASSENIGLAGTVVGAADTVAQFVMHATPEGMVGLSATVLGAAATLMSMAEKHKDGKEKGKP